MYIHVYYIYMYYYYIVMVSVISYPCMQYLLSVVVNTLFCIILLLLGKQSQLVTVAMDSHTNDSTSELQVGLHPVLTTPTESTGVDEGPEPPHTPHRDHSVHQGTHVLYFVYLFHSSLLCRVYSVCTYLFIPI